MARDAEPREVRLTNLRKVFWPDDGYTKGDLIAYYDAVAPLILPYLRDRPVVLTRYPDGIKGKSFFQKDAPVFVPDWVRTESVYSKDSDRDIRFFVLDDAESLRYVANLGTIPIHMWSARSGSLERPDWMVLDLDPKGAPFTDVIEVAVALRKLLEELELPSHLKTSGATGLHILIPLGRRYTHEECKTFARLLAMLAQQAKPEISTLARPLHARGGQGLHRLGTERARDHDRRAVFAAAAAGRAGLVPVAVERGERAGSILRRFNLQDAAEALREDRGSALGRAGEGDRHGRGDRGDRGVDAAGQGGGVTARAGAAPAIEGRMSVPGAGEVSTLLLRPEGCAALFVLAHGAGAGMRHSFMEAIAQRLAAHGIGTLRYQFPYIEARTRRPDPEPILLGHRARGGGSRAARRPAACRSSRAESRWAGG